MLAISGSRRTIVLLSGIFLVTAVAAGTAVSKWPHGVAHAGASSKDVGLVRYGEPLLASFEITNVGSRPLKIHSVEPQCPSRATLSSTEVAPGKTVILRIEQDTTRPHGLQPSGNGDGALTASVTVRTSDPAMSRITFQAKAQIWQEFVPSTRVVMWPSDRKSHTQEVTIGVHSRATSDILEAVSHVDGIIATLVRTHGDSSITIRLSSSQPDVVPMGHIALLTSSTATPTIVIPVRPAFGNANQE
jgi:hypothetical protein